MDAKPLRSKRLLAKMAITPGAGGGGGLQSIGYIPPSGALAAPPHPAANPNVGQAQQGTRGKKSDQRFRSFAERWMVARAHLLRADPDGLLEDTWSAVLDARRAYTMIKSVGENIEPEDGVF